MKYPKHPRKENRALLILARDKPCLMLATHNCRMLDGSTTVAAHSNELRHGKGKGMKAHDYYTVWACSNCHAWYDQSGAPKAEKQRAWESAHKRQIDAWRKMSQENSAAKWALENIEDEA